MTEIPATSHFGGFLNWLFGYEGRIGRLSCVMGFLTFCAILAFLSGMAQDAVAGTGDIGRYVAFGLIVGTGLWIHSAVAVKRLHDRDKSAWWYLLYGVTPLALFIGALYLYTARAFDVASILFVVSIVGLTWVIVELGFLRGTDGPNRYGPAP